MRIDLDGLTEGGALEAVLNLVDDLKVARAAVEAAERRTASLRKLIDGLVELYPSIEDHLPEDLDEDEEPRPRGAEAVRRVLEMNKGSWYVVSGVVSLLQQQGWLPESSNPANAVRTSLERLVEGKAIAKGRTKQGAVIYRVGTDEDRARPTYSGDEEPF